MDDPQLQRFVQAQGQALGMNKLITDLTERCWPTCMGKPGQKLDSKTQACFRNCVQRFIDSSNYINNRLVQIGNRSSKSNDDDFSL